MKLNIVTILGSGFSLYLSMYLAPMSYKSVYCSAMNMNSPYIMQIQEYLTNPVQVKVGKVSSPTENVSQNLVKITENEKVCQLLPLSIQNSVIHDIDLELSTYLK